MPNSRSLSFDALKGIGIILVVLGHVTQNSIGGWIYSFHMPLFFLVSGLFFHPSDGGYVKKAKRLLVPYFVFAILSFLYWRFVEIRFREVHDGVDVNLHALDIVWQCNEFQFNVALWFLPCLFLLTCLANFVFSKITNRYILMILSVLWLLAACFFSLDLPLMWINELFFAFPFFVLGYWLGSIVGNIEGKLSQANWGFRLLAIVPLIILFLIPHGGDMQKSIYPNGYFYYFVVAVVCVASLTVLSSMLCSQKWLLWLSSNSLTIMCLHEPLKRIVLKVASITIHQDVEVIRTSVLGSLIISAIVIGVLVPLCIFINKKMSWVLARLFHLRLENRQ